MNNTKKGAGKEAKLVRKRKKDNRFFLFAGLAILVGLFIWGVSNNDSKNLSQDNTSIKDIVKDDAQANISATITEVEDDKTMASTSSKRKSSASKRTSGTNSSSTKSKRSSGTNTSSSSTAKNTQTRSKTSSSSTSIASNNSKPSSRKASSSKRSIKNNVAFTIDQEAIQYFSTIEAQKQASAFQKSNTNTDIVTSIENGKVYLSSKNELSITSTSSTSEFNQEFNQEFTATITDENNPVPSRDLSTLKGIKTSNEDDKEINIDDLFEDVLFAADGTIIPHSGIGYGDDLFPLRDTLPWHPYISLAYIKEEKETFVCEKVRKFPKLGDQNPIQIPGSLGELNNKIDYGVAINPNK